MSRSDAVSLLLRIPMVASSNRDPEPGYPESSSQWYYSALPDRLQNKEINTT